MYKAQGGAAPAKRERIHALDAMRGLAVVLMVLHHAAYSYRFFFGGGIDLYTPFLGIAVFFVCMFFTISGISSHLSRSNFARSIKTLAVALAITAVTYIAENYFHAEGSLILFGVLHCLGTCMLIYAFAGKYTDRLFGRATPLVWAGLFVVFRLFWGGQCDVPYLFALGYWGKGFYSADYYPVIPWIFMFLFGGATADFVVGRRLPQRFYDFRCGFLEWVGRHALPVYVLQQPLIFALLYVITRFTALP